MMKILEMEERIRNPLLESNLQDMENFTGMDGAQLKIKQKKIDGQIKEKKYEFVPAYLRKKETKAIY